MLFRGVWTFLFGVSNEERADWTLLASAVPSYFSLKVYCICTLRISLTFLYSTLPNIDSNFVPGSFVIL